MKTIVRCDSCGAMILEPYDENKVNRCPRCGRIQSLQVVDLAHRPDVRRRLKALRAEGPAQRRRRLTRE
jgi:phage FluMu protein Com